MAVLVPGGMVILMPRMAGSFPWYEKFTLLNLTSPTGDGSWIASGFSTTPDVSLN